MLESAVSAWRTEGGSPLAIRRGWTDAGRGTTRGEILGAASGGGIGAAAAAQDAPESDHNPRDEHTPESKDPVDVARDRTLFATDPDKKMAEQRVPGHNRWHPDIPPVAEVSSGEAFFVECRGWTDLQVHNTDSAGDVREDIMPV